MLKWNPGENNLGSQPRLDNDSVKKLVRVDAALYTQRRGTEEMDLVPVPQMLLEALATGRQFG